MITDGTPACDDRCERLLIASRKPTTRERVRDCTSSALARTQIGLARRSLRDPHAGTSMVARDRMIFL